MADSIVGKIEKIPEGSKLQTYSNEMVVLFKGFDGDKFEEFLKKVFHETYNFLLAKKLTGSIIKLLLIYNSDKYQQIETETSKKAISKEIAKGSSTSFISNISGIPTIVVNIERLFQCIKSGYPTFILNLVNNYIHEMLHAGFPSKSEQETYDLECLLVEEFLSVELPKEFKNLKASDYYQAKKP